MPVSMVPVNLTRTRTKRCWQLTKRCWQRARVDALVGIDEYGGSESRSDETGVLAPRQRLRAGRRTAVLLRPPQGGGRFTDERRRRERRRPSAIAAGGGGRGGRFVDEIRLVARFLR